MYVNLWVYLCAGAYLELGLELAKAVAEHKNFMWDILSLKDITARLFVYLIDLYIRITNYLAKSTNPSSFRAATNNIFFRSGVGLSAVIRTELEIMSNGK